MGNDIPNEDQVSRLYEEMYECMFAYALSVLQDSHLAEEAVQDTFCILCMKAEQALEKTNPNGWLMRTLQNVIRNMKRQRAAMNRLIMASLQIEDLIDAIIYISEVIAKRDKQSGAPAVNVDAAWEQFRTKYLPYADGRSLYDFDDEEPGCVKATAAASGDPAPNGKKHISPRGRRRLGRIAILAAAVAVLLSLMMATTYALGYDLWGTFAQWTKETFAFVSGSVTGNTEEPVTEVEYASLQAALDAYGVAEPLAPNWIPDGFVLDSVSVDDTSSPRVIIFQANYCCEDRWIAIQITMHRDANSVAYTEWQKDGGDVTTIELENCTFYVMRNAERECAAWSSDPFEGYITGDITVDELSEIIKSIYSKE